jgi:hypothetical protein
MDTPEIIIHASDFSLEMKKSLEEYIEKNLSWKLDSYIKKHEKPNSPLRVELTVKKSKEGKYDGKVTLSVWPKPYRSDREDFSHLDDLVNHLFTHLKEQMSK